MLIDIHTHLDFCKEPAVKLLREAAADGVGLVIQSGIDLESSRFAVQLAEEEPGVFATVGFHPHEAARFTEAAFDELRD
ncbi:MAG: TatD family hydrolase, partial [Thermoleophilia bacterium]|nr:TatD family hydrolase [Thermoleophilia bacterium]